MKFGTGLLLSTSMFAAGTIVTTQIANHVRPANAAIDCYSAGMNDARSLIETYQSAGKILSTFV